MLKSFFRAAGISLLIHSAAVAQTLPPTVISVDLKQDQGPLPPIWAWFGYDEPNYTYMKDGKNCSPSCRS